MDRIFGLDIQLGFDVLLQAIAVFIMFAALSYLLFEPARKLLEKRKDKIAKELDDAAANQDQAAKLKAEYEAKMNNIEQEANQILEDARKRGIKREEEIVAEAKEEAATIRKRAENDIALQQVKARDQVKQQIVDVAVLMAGKMIAKEIDAKEQDALINQTIQEMGDELWQQE